MSEDKARFLAAVGRASGDDEVCSASDFDACDVSHFI